MQLKPRPEGVDKCRQTSALLRQLVTRLNLQTPVVTLDLELTGTLRDYDRICEIAAVKVYPNLTYNILTTLVNPLMPISPEATAKNKITDADVADAPQFGEIGRLLRPGLAADVILFGFNMRGLDIPVLEREYARIGLAIDLSGKPVIDPFVIASLREARDLSALYKLYCDKELPDAHMAAADLGPPIEIFFAQLDRYDDLPTDVSALSSYCERRRPEYVDRAGKFHRRGGRIMIAFGQHMGEYIDSVDTGFLLWMVNKDFEHGTKEVCREELRRRNGPQQGSLLAPSASSFQPF